jgi:(1->4)-alpha-D-glucan 1-alpha-D-glucosylmutase
MPCAHPDSASVRVAERTAAPRATYRVQLHKGFTFRDATDVVGYLSELGFSHLYCSPITKARPGSTHGYDIVDHNQLNPEIGTDAEFEALAAALSAHGMGLILDIVPNHMGVGTDNAWWVDVLEWGQLSPYAGFFDIDWASSRRNLEGKVLLPVLGDQFGKVLEAGEIQLRFDRDTGSFSAWYYEHRFPVVPFDYGRILRPAAEALNGVEREELRSLCERFAGLKSLRRDVRVLRTQAAELKRELADHAARQASVMAAIEHALEGFDAQAKGCGALGRLLDGQAYRPAYWRVASDEINYRRFFNINDLGGLRVELRELFEETHRRIFRLVEDGKVDGLRVDHIDGLFDPLEYVERLQARVGRPGEPFYIVVEKILAQYEDLPDAWPIAGTTGYDTLNLIGGLFVDPAGERPLDLLYRRFARRTQAFDDILYESKQRILRANLASEVAVLANEMHRLSSSHWRSRDFTFNGMRAALEEILARFPVYRTYVNRGGASAIDRRYIDWAIGVAKKRALQADTSIYDFLHELLTGDLAEPYRREDVIFLAMRFQQLSGPAMAKGLEDTSFYRHFRLIALNEVGGDPRRFSVSLAAFHHVNDQRLKRRPNDMLAGTTHDTKRGEDARARIACLAGMAVPWGERVMGWERFNRRLHTELDGVAAPDRNDEYYFYQTLVGVWPPVLEPDDVEGVAALADRIEPALIKALREGKEKSSWSNPNDAYEQALCGFVRRALDAGKPNPFLVDFHGFLTRVAFLGALTSVSQTLLRLTIPGVPDVYRGAELWELSLVDPDNRRPIDYAACRARFEAVKGAKVHDLVETWRDGGIKLCVIWRALELRRLRSRLFAAGAYRPLQALGERAEHVVGFARVLDEDAVIVVAPRFWPSLWPEHAAAPDWGDTAIEVPAGRYVDVFTGRTIEMPQDGTVLLRDLVGEFPVALLDGCILRQ